jgi:RNA-directed DNA polymerase
MDLAKFFDTVNQSRLIRRLSLKIKDGRVISLIHKMLRSGVQINGEIKPTEIGLMQGGLCRHRHNDPYDDIIIMPRNLLEAP